MLKVLKLLPFIGLCFVATARSASFNFGRVDGHVGALSNQMSSNIGNVPGNRYNIDANIDFKKDFKSRYSTDSEARFNLSALRNDESLMMYSLQEAYIGKRFTSKDHFRIGRQVLDWSPVDAHWGFGKVNNRMNFNFFEPGQEGLVGMTYERRSSNNMRYGLFGSVLYVPELNPEFDINKKRGTVKSRHPWADAPATSAPILGVDTPIRYEVDVPEATDVVRKASFGGNIGMESKHWFFDNFFMRKPENQMSQKVDVKVVSIPGQDDFIRARVKPQFYYHDVIGSSLRYRNQDVELYASVISSKPNTYPDVDSAAVLQTEIRTKKYREDYLGVGISRINDLYGMGFHYVARLSPYDRDKDFLSIDPRWNQALNFYLARKFFQRISLSADIKYDMLTTDRLAMFRASYLARKNLLVNLGVNLIGTPNNGKSFWSPYTNNDALYAGMRYVF